jgi:hypothetical protein
MNYNQKLLIEGIREFESYVSIVESSFKYQYNLEISPLLAYTRKSISKKGVLSSIKGIVNFCFHGSGCEAKFGSIVVDYDYHGKNFTYQGFGSWKLWEFLISKGSKYQPILDRDIFFKIIDSLEKLGQIRNINPPFKTYEFLDRE